jgi:hypothetical protein
MVWLDRNGLTKTTDSFTVSQSVKNLVTVSRVACILPRLLLKHNTSIGLCISRSDCTRNQARGCPVMVTFLGVIAEFEHDEAGPLEEYQRLVMLY